LKLHRCGFCNKKVQTFILCLHCNRRTYCSVECKDKDWTKEGQWHQTWCSHYCGEEHSDWEVQESQGRRCKVVALTDFRRGSKIVVEKAKIVKKTDLSLEESFRQSCSMNQISSFISCSRACQFGHSCLPNASHVFNEELNLITVFAEREIKAGEEITLDFHPFSSPFQSYSLHDMKRILKNKFQIVCLPDCACHDEEKFEQIQTARRLNSLCAEFVKQGNFVQAFQTSKKLLGFYDVMNAGILTRARTRLIFTSLLSLSVAEFKCSLIS
jgi:hypothetical protein